MKWKETSATYNSLMKAQICKSSCDRKKKVLTNSMKFTKDKADAKGQFSGLYLNVATSTLVFNENCKYLMFSTLYL